MLISHNLNDVFEVADDIAILYLGAMVGQVETSDYTREQIVTAITTGQLPAKGTNTANGGAA